MTWLLAGLFAGVVSGAVAWFISLFYENLYVEAPAQRGHHVRGVHRAAGVPGGDRRRRDRPLARRPQGPDEIPHHGAFGDDDDRADTDVFAAVRHDGPDDTHARPAPVAEPRLARYAAPAGSPARRGRRSHRATAAITRVRTCIGAAWIQLGKSTSLSLCRTTARRPERAVLRGSQSAATMVDRQLGGFALDEHQVVIWRRPPSRPPPAATDPDPPAVPAWPARRARRSAAHRRGSSCRRPWTPAAAAARRRRS